MNYKKYLSYFLYGIDHLRNHYALLSVPITRKFSPFSINHSQFAILLFQFIYSQAMHYCLAYFMIIIFVMILIYFTVVRSLFTFQWLGLICFFILYEIFYIIYIINICILFLLLLETMNQIKYLSFYHLRFLLS